MNHVAVLGGGSWGTTLANLIAHNGHPIRLWLRDRAIADEINTQHTNAKYLPSLPLHPDLQAITDLEQVAKNADCIFIILPSQHLRPILHSLAPFLHGGHTLIHGVKGIEQHTFLLPSQIIRNETCCRLIGVLSGPNLAKEVAVGQPSATVISSHYEDVLKTGVACLHGSTFRVYTNEDVIGTELGGSLKNIMAIAAGMIAGLGLGDNTRSLLLTRGLHEMARLGIHMGALAGTFSGLSGMGDLIATCSSNLSRNYQVGFGLAQGKSLDEITQEIQQTSEGVLTTKTVAHYAREHGVFMPITQAIYRILYDHAPIPKTIRDLMSIETPNWEFETNLGDR